MDDSEKEGLNNRKTSDINDGWQETNKKTFNPEVFAISLLHERLDTHENGTPTTYQVECDRLLDICCTMEVVIAVHSKFIMMFPH